MKLVAITTLALVGCGRIGFGADDGDSRGDDDAGPRDAPRDSAPGTWAIVQTPSVYCGAPISTCTLPVSPTGTGNLLVIVMTANTVQVQPATIASVTGGGTWTHPTCASDNSLPFLDCAYASPSTPGATSIRVDLDGEANHAALVMFELGTPPGTILLENLPGATFPGQTNPPGQATSPSGSDAIVQAISWENQVGGISLPYISIGRYDGLNAGFLAVDLNTSDGSAPTWSTQYGNGTTLGLAFRAN